MSYAAPRTQLVKRLQQLLEKLSQECDPATWPALDTKEGRGNGVWLRKNAYQTALIARALIETLNSLKRLEGTEGAPPPTGSGAGLTTAEELDVAELEQQAAELTARVRGKVSNAP